MNGVDSQFEKLNRLKDRMPSNSSVAVHRALDDYLEERFGHKFRSNATFTCGSKVVARSYSKARKIFHVFPIGEFKYAWSEVMEDAFFYFDSAGTPTGRHYIEKVTGRKAPANSRHSILVDVSSADWGDQVAEFLQKEGKRFYRDTDLESAIQDFPNHEVMISADSYYILQYGTPFARKVLDHLKTRK